MTELFDQFEQPICPAKLFSFGSRLHNEGIAGVPEPEYFHCPPSCEGPVELTAKYLGLFLVKKEVCPRFTIDHFLSSTIG